MLYVMLEFIFGWLLGVWMGQQLPLPSVQTQIESWWKPPAKEEDAGTEVTDETDIPVFTGDMPMA